MQPSINPSLLNGSSIPTNVSVQYAYNAFTNTLVPVAVTYSCNPSACLAPGLNSQIPLAANWTNGLSGVSGLGNLSGIVPGIPTPIAFPANCGNLAQTPTGAFVITR